MEARADLKQAADAPSDLDHAAAWGGDARENLEQRALASAVAPNDAQRLALIDRERDVVQSQDALADAREGIPLTYAGVGVGLLAHPRPPAVEVAAERARADHTQIVLFGKMFNGYNWITHLILSLMDPDIISVGIRTKESENGHYPLPIKKRRSCKGKG